jgi:CheY-like chemotaxis protein
MEPSKPLILSTGSDEVLLLTRTMLLERAGYRVVTCFARDALRKLREAKGEIAGAVLGQSINVEERIELAREMRQIAPDLAIVLVHLPGDRFDASICDAVVETLSAPESLVRAVQRALKRRAK